MSSSCRAEYIFPHLQHKQELAREHFLILLLWGQRGRPAAAAAGVLAKKVQSCLCKACRAGGRSEIDWSIETRCAGLGLNCCEGGIAGGEIEGGRERWRGMERRLGAICHVFVRNQQNSSQLRVLRVLKMVLFCDYACMYGKDGRMHVPVLGKFCVFGCMFGWSCMLKSRPLTCIHGFSGDVWMDTRRYECKSADVA